MNMYEEHITDEHITDEQWLAYFDGEVQGRITAHISGCPECAQFAASMRGVETTLAGNALLFREAARLSDDEMDRLFARVLEAQNRRFWTAREAMLLLRALVEPICGAGTAGATMHLAMQRSTTGNVTGKNWRLFVSNLSDTMASICGSAAGRLVSRAGFALAVEEA